jgi:hypothetical protein
MFKEAKEMEYADGTKKVTLLPPMGIGTMADQTLFDKYVLNFNKRIQKYHGLQPNKNRA